MKRFAAAIAFLAGVALATALAVHAGLGATLQALAAIGWYGLAKVCGLQILALALCGLAWWAVTHGAGLRACLVSRWIRMARPTSSASSRRLGKASAPAP
ncbi:MAG: hypothetical protein WDM92_13010 [Caulobacteraceae bacterium]